MPIELCKVEGCENFKNGRYCLLHKKLTGKVEVKKIYTISKVAPNRKIENKEYEKEKKKYLKENPLCEARLKNCKVHSQDIHHQKKRRTKDDRINPENFLAVCRSCHIQIEAKPKMAMELGLSKKAIN